MQLWKNRIVDQLLQLSDLPNYPELHQEFCGNKPGHQHLQWKYQQVHQDYDSIVLEYTWQSGFT